MVECQLCDFTGQLSEMWNHLHDFHCVMNERMKYTTDDGPDPGWSPDKGQGEFIELFTANMAIGYCTHDGDRINAPIPLTVRTE